MASRLEIVDDLNFEAEVLASKEPYLLDFSATWCAPCRALAPILEALAEEYRGRVRFGTLDIDSSPVVAAQLAVRGAPTLVLFHNGREVTRKLGFTHKKALVELLSPVASETTSELQLQP